jgi:hypothetical protein
VSDEMNFFVVALSVNPEAFNSLWAACKHLLIVWEEASASLQRKDCNMKVIFTLGKSRYSEVKYNPRV